MIAVPCWNVNFRVPCADAIAESAGAVGGTVMMPSFDAPGFAMRSSPTRRAPVFSISESRV